MRPLEDVRIVAVEQYGAGPCGSVHLADLGADVIKIEDPRVGGDVGRYVPPYQAAEDSLFYQSFNRNKRSISLDLSSDAGRRVFQDIVASSDAVYSNLRGDIPEKLGLTYAQLRHVNERIVCCSLTGFGQSGPRRAEPAYDYILQGLAGWMSLTGEPDGPPAKSGLSLVDFSTGLVAALSLVVGVHAARRDGVGMDCDVALFDVAIGMLSYLGAWHLTAGYTPARTARSAHPSLVPFGNFPTADGWIVIGCAKEKFWQRLAHAIDRSDLVDDPRFATFGERNEHRGELVAILDDVLMTRPTAEWVERIGAVGVPVGPVNNVEQAFADPQTAACDLVLEIEHPEGGVVRQPASPVRVGGARPPLRRAPTRDEHRDAILRDLLGYDADVVSELHKSGAFGADERARAG